MKYVSFILTFVLCISTSIKQSYSQCPEIDEVTLIISNRNIESLDSLINYWTECNINNDTLLALAYHMLGVTYYQEKILDKAIEANRKALKIREIIFKENSFLIGRSHANLGVFYFEFGDIEVAEKHNKKALDIYLVNNNGQPTRAINVALELVKIHGLLGDYGKCLNYYKIAIGLAKKSNDPESIARAYTTYGNQLLEMNFNQECFDNAKNAIQIYETEIEDVVGLGGNLLNAGNALFKMKKYKDALPYFNESMKALDGTYEYEKKWSLNNSLGQLFTKEKDFEKAFFYLGESAKIIKENTDLIHLVPINLHNIGDIYFDQQDYETALEYFHKAIASSIKNFSDINVAVSPLTQNLSPVEEKSYLLEHFSKKAACWVHISYQKEKEKNLKLALENYHLAAQLIDMMREEFTAQGSKLHWLKAAYPILENAIKVSITLHKITGDESYSKEVLNFMEKNKAVLLLESINRSKDLYLADVPDSLLFQQKRLKNQIARMQRSFLENQKKSIDQGNESINIITENKLASANIKLSDLEESMKAKYPSFNQLSKIRTRNLEDIRSILLDNDRGLIEYFVGDSLTYIAAVSKNKFAIKAIPTKEIRKQTEDLLYVIHPSRSQKAGSKDFFQRFTKSSHTLYTMLLEEVLTDFPKSIDQLIIVPDDVISFLPFDILLQEAYDSETVNYSPNQLNYLINNYTITYTYSGTVLFDALNEEKKEFDHLSFLGVAPGFGGDTDISSGRACNFENPQALKYNQSEVQKINELLSGSVITGDDATKASFIDLASRFSILHLATHACADPENAARNRIFFSDGYLYNHELSNLNNAASMVVLSACETGIGEFKRGEGVMSLARGFAYSGTPSITMSLWSVDDGSTSELMVNYYKYLMKGEAKDIALRKAKLDYLSNQEDIYKLHPRFWAAFVHYGDMTPIVKKTSWIWYLVGGALLLTAMGLGHLYRKKIAAV